MNNKKPQTMQPQTIGSLALNQGAKYFLSASEFAEYDETSVRSVRRAIANGTIVVTKVKGKKGRRKNHVDVRIHYGQLSTKEAQDRFLQDRNLLIPNKTQPTNGFFLTEKQKQLKTRKEQAVKDYLAISKNLPHGRKLQVKTRTANAYGLSLRTFERALTDYAEAGSNALVPGWRGGKKERKLADDKEATAFIQKVYMVELGPSILETYEKYCQQFENSRARLFSYSAVANFIKQTWSQSERDLVREPDKWQKIHSLWVPRDWEKAEVNEVWFGDAKQIDIACTYKNRVIFPWLTAFVDARSQKFVGWVLTASPDKWAIAQAFDYGIVRHGIPKVIYIDRGKPYKSQLISGGKVRAGKLVKLFDNIENESFVGIFQEFGCEIFYAYPRNAREKLIEAIFRIFTYRQRHLPGYRGHSPAHRPRKLEAEIKAGKLLTFEELSSDVDRVINERNARPRSAGDAKTPNDYYANHTPVVPSEAVRAFLKMDRHWVKIANGGVTVGSNRDFYRGQSLWLHSGEHCEVRRDPADIRNAAVIQNDQLLEIVQLERAGHYRDPITLKHRETVAKINKQIRAHRKALLGQGQGGEDPLKTAMAMGDEPVKLRSRDIRPGANVTALNKRERLARETRQALEKAENSQPFQSVAAVSEARKNDMLYRLLAAAPPLPTRRPLRVIPEKNLTMFHPDEEDE